MDDKEKNSFLTFIKILAETGNMTHAIEESGWAEDLHDSEDKDLPVVDLRKIPRSEWSDYIAVSVALPPAIERYIKNGEKPLPLTERHSIADALEKYYATDPDFCIIDTDDGDFYLGYT